MHRMNYRNQLNYTDTIYFFINKDGWALHWASRSVHNDHKIVLIAISKNIKANEYASSALHIN